MKYCEIQSCWAQGMQAETNLGSSVSSAGHKAETLGGAQGKLYEKKEKNKVLSKMNT